MNLSDLHDHTLGYLLDDTILVEAELWKVTLKKKKQESDFVGLKKQVTPWFCLNMLNMFLTGEANGRGGSL